MTKNDKKEQAEQCTIPSVMVSSLKIEDFIDGFKFRYRGKPYVWMDKTISNPICHNIKLLEDELDLGYVTAY